MLFHAGFRFMVLAAAGLLVAGCLTRPDGAGRPADAARSRAVRPGTQSSSPEAEKRLVEAHARYATAVIHELNREHEQALEEYFKAAACDLANETLVLEVSRRLLQARQPEKALDLVSRATALPGASGNLFARLGFVYAQLGRKDRAIQANRTAIRREPRSLVGYQNLFLIHVQNSETREALGVLDQAARVHPVEPGFLIGLGELYASFGMQTPAQRETAYGKGLALLQRASKMDLPDPQLRVRLANAFNMIGREDDAAVAYEELLKHLRDVPFLRDSVRARLAEIYLRNRNNERAAQQLQNLLRDNPTDVQAYYYLGQLAYREEKFDAAVEYFSKVLLLDPDSEPDYYYDLASAQLSADRPADALGTIEKAREKFPANFFMEYLAAMACTAQEQYTNALSHFNTAEILGAANPVQLRDTFYFQFGAACERAGDYTGAEMKFEKCLELSPNFAEAQNYLGYMLAERGEQLERAHDLIAKALTAEPENAAYLDSMGWVLFKLKRTQEALGYLLEAVKHSEEEDATLYDHLGDIYAALSQPEKAREAWRKSVALDDRDEVRVKLESNP